jgi:hypothetical protein
MSYTFEELSKFSVGTLCVMNERSYLNNGQHPGNECCNPLMLIAEHVNKKEKVGSDEDYPEDYPDPVLFKDHVFQSFCTTMHG